MGSQFVLRNLFARRCYSSIAQSSAFAAKRLSPFVQKINGLTSTIGGNHLQRITLIRYCAQAEGEIVFELESDDDFDDRVLQAEQPVMVQFYADWCGPCRSLWPRLEAKIIGQNGRILLARVNVDAAGELPAQFGVTSVPTVLCFREGEVVHRFEGADVEDDYLDEVMTNLAVKQENSYKGRDEE